MKAIAFCVTSSLDIYDAELASTFLSPQLPLDEAKAVSDNVNITFRGSY